MKTLPANTAVNILLNYKFYSETHKLLTLFMGVILTKNHIKIQVSLRFANKGKNTRKD